MTKVTKTQQTLLDAFKGRRPAESLRRHKGGYWHFDDAEMTKHGPEPWWGTPTVGALLNMKILKETPTSKDEPFHFKRFILVENIT